MSSEDSSGVGCLLLVVLVVGWVTYLLWDKAELLERLRTDEAISGVAVAENGTQRTDDFGTPGVLVWRSWCEREVSDGEDTHTEYKNRFRNTMPFRVREPSGASALVEPGVVVLLSVEPHVKQGRPGGWWCYEIVVKPGDRVTVVGDLEHVGLDRRLNGELHLFSGGHKDAEQQVLVSTSWRVWAVGGVNLLMLVVVLLWVFADHESIGRRWSELFSPLQVVRRTEVKMLPGELLHRVRRGLLEGQGAPLWGRVVAVGVRLSLLPLLGAVLGLLVWLEGPVFFLLIERLFSPEGFTLAAARYGAMVGVGVIGLALLLMFAMLRIKSPWEHQEGDTPPAVEQARDAFVQLMPWLLPVVEPSVAAGMRVLIWDRWAGQWVWEASVLEELVGAASSLEVSVHCRTLSSYSGELHSLKITHTAANNTVSNAVYTWSKGELEADPRPIGLQMAERLSAWLMESDLKVRALRLGELARESRAVRLRPASREPDPVADERALSVTLRHELIQSPHPSERPSRRGWAPGLVYAMWALGLMAGLALCVVGFAVAPPQPNTLIGTVALASLLFVLGAFYFPRLSRDPRETLLTTSALRLGAGRLELGEEAIPLVDAAEAGGLTIGLTRSPETVGELALLGVEVTDTSVQPPVRLRWRVPVKAEDVSGLPELDLNAPLMDAEDFGEQVWPALRWYGALGGGERLPEAWLPAVNAP